MKLKVFRVHIARRLVARCKAFSRVAGLSYNVSFLLDFLAPTLLQINMGLVVEETRLPGGPCSQSMLFRGKEWRHTPASHSPSPQ